MKTLLIMLLILKGNGLVYASFEQEFNQARDAYRHYNHNEQGDLFDAVWVAFERLGQQYPDHPGVQIYLGSLEAIKARDAWMPWRKLKWVEQGLDRIDRGLTLLESGEYDHESGGISISDDCRVVAVSTFIAVPGFLNRFQDGKDVFLDLTAGRDLTALPQPFQTVIYQIGIRIAHKEGHADDLNKWQKQLTQLQ